jgi:hypothetical protein
MLPSVPSSGGEVPRGPADEESDVDAKRIATLRATPKLGTRTGLELAGCMGSHTDGTGEGHPLRARLLGSIMFRPRRHIPHWFVGSAASRS